MICTSLSTKQNRGMTLIEVILALGLFALMSVFLTQTISSVLGIWQAGERRGRGDLVWAATAARFASDLNAVHLGRRGWFILDDYEARPANEDHPALMLPRLRFLARGEALNFDQSQLRGAVELAWVVIPESPDYGSLLRLVRLSQAEDILDASASFQDDNYFSSLVRGGAGLTVLDSVAWADFSTQGLSGNVSKQAFIAARQQVDFPQWVALNLERVDAATRRKPHRLDDAVLGTTHHLKRTCTRQSLMMMTVHYRLTDCPLHHVFSMQVHVRRVQSVRQVLIKRAAGNQTHPLHAKAYAEHWTRAVTFEHRQQCCFKGLPPLIHRRRFRMRLLAPWLHGRIVATCKDEPITLRGHFLLHTGDAREKDRHSSRSHHCGGIRLRHLESAFNNVRRHTNARARHTQRISPLPSVAGQGILRDSRRLVIVRGCSRASMTKGRLVWHMTLDAAAPRTI